MVLRALRGLWGATDGQDWEEEENVKDAKLIALWASGQREALPIAHLGLLAAKKQYISTAQGRPAWWFGATIAPLLFSEVAFRAKYYGIPTHLRPGVPFAACRSKFPVCSSVPSVMLGLSPAAAGIRNSALVDESGPVAVPSPAIRGVLQTGVLRQDLHAE